MPMPVYSLDQCVSQALNVEIGDDEIPDGSKLQVRVSHVIEKLNFGSFLSNIPCGLQFVCLINQSNQWHCVNIKHCLSCIHCHLIINWGNCVSSAMMHLESPVVHIASLAVYLCGVCPWSVLMLQTQGGGMCAESFQLGWCFALLRNTQSSQQWSIQCHQTQSLSQSKREKTTETEKQMQDRFRRTDRYWWTQLS